jgi:hypothetical protein
MAGTDFRLDLSELRRAIRYSSQYAGEAAEEALDEIKDDWVMEARDLAPIDSGNLRQQIKGRVQESGLDSSIMVTANARNSSDNGTFNYGYYIHELDAGSDLLRTPGTEKKFLEKSVDEQKYQRHLVRKVKDKLRSLGWNGN